jgi:hypothetical protein
VADGEFDRASLHWQVHADGSSELTDLLVAIA